jgi:hypothetical protein
MENNYSVSSRRVTTEWFGTKRFYVPVVHDRHNGIVSAMQDISEMTSVWGYDTEDEAWAVIDVAIRKDEENECDAVFSDRDRCRDSGREDFHADG